MDIAFFREFNIGVVTIVKCACVIRFEFPYFIHTLMSALINITYTHGLKLWAAICKLRFYSRYYLAYLLWLSRAKRRASIMGPSSFRSSDKRNNSNVDAQSSDIAMWGPVKCRWSLHCYWWSKEASRFWRTIQFMQIFKNANVDVPFFLPPKALNSCLGNMSKLCFCLVQEKSAERQCAHDFHWGKYFTTLYCILCF